MNVQLCQLPQMWGILPRIRFQIIIALFPFLPPAVVLSILANDRNILAYVLAPPPLNMSHHSHAMRFRNVAYSTVFDLGSSIPSDCPGMHSRGALNITLCKVHRDSSIYLKTH